MTEIGLKTSACLELLFTDEPDFVKRIARAKQAGFDAVEFWQWSNKDIPAIVRQVRAHEMAVAGFVAEPMISLVDPGLRADFSSGLARSVEVAKDLSAPFLYAQSGQPVDGMRADEMFASICENLNGVADQLEGSGVTLLLEPVSDSPGNYLHDNALGFDIIETVNRPEVRLLYDFYHANVFGEDWHAALPRLHLAAHIHVADHPGRGAPGTGELPIAEFLKTVEAHGYAGMIGYEHK